MKERRQGALKHQNPNPPQHQNPKPPQTPSHTSPGVILNDIGNSCERTDYNYVAGSSGNASLVAFTRCLGGVSMDHGVRILAVSPGPVDTGRLETMLKKRAGLAEWGGQEDKWQVRRGGGEGGCARGVCDV